MSKLQLLDIHKSYKLGDGSVLALRGVSLEFRESEFVSILGPSGCGKTTLLNVIGGLDRYDSGDLVINGLSTKQFKDSDWDAYRNRSIGFVFQNYNLIAHQSVLHNVEISMTLAGVSPTERRRRAIEALQAVGLDDQLRKKPAQLSGGQMQRVAIARALVNNPDIILADEPTGALDSQTSAQVMDILKEIAKTRLVIVVTHNREIAEGYSSRIIRILDGQIQSDSNPIVAEEATSKTTAKRVGHTSMSLATASSLSFRNLLTKKGRTIITSFAGSIGIIGVAMVLALSSGLSSYIAAMQSGALAGFPVTISREAQTIRMGPGHGDGPLSARNEEGKFPEGDVIHSFDSAANTTRHTNNLTKDFLTYVEKLTTELPGAVNTIAYTRGVGMNVLAKGQDTVVLYSASPRNSSGMGELMGFGSAYWQEMPDNRDFILSLYDFLGPGSRLPNSKNEILLVVDEYNRLDKAFFTKLGITTDQEYRLADFIGKELLSVIPNDEYYTQNGDLFTAAPATEYDRLFASPSGLRLTVVGVLRIKKDAASAYFSEGLVYTSELTEHIVQSAQESAIARAQKEADRNIITGAPFTDGAAKERQLSFLGADTTPTGINIYPRDFASKDRIKDYLDHYNVGKEEKDQIVYTDLAEIITSVTGALINTVSYVLIGFAAISLVVSTIMIAIITYVSVIERTKEIGVLRAVGARKRDISRVFNAETLIIGLTAGLLGVGLSYLISVPVNLIVMRLVDIQGIAALPITQAVVLVLGSMGLTLIAGFIPSRIAAKKDPVEALRTE